MNALVLSLANRSNGNGPRGPEHEGRLLVCVICDRVIHPEREKVPAHADVKCCKRCAELR